MVPEEIKNEWIRQIDVDFPETGETIRLLKIIILLKQETAYYQGEGTVLKETVEHYRDMYAEDVCTCLHCLLERSEEDEDEDGMGRDGLPKLGKDEDDKLNKMWNKD